jgi:hypothetical protein
MTVGPRIGVAVGPRVGVASGVGEDDLFPPTTDVLVGVSRDATSGVYCPANTAEWQIVYTAAGINPALTPSAVWLMQEASGNLADSVSTFTLVPTGAGIAYQQTEPGWARKSITTTEGADGVLTNTDAGLIDILVGSCAILSYCRTTTSALLRSIFGMGAAATRCSAERLATGAPMIRCGAVPQDGIVSAAGDIRPWWLTIDRTSLLAELDTDLERIIPTFSALASGKRITFGTLQNFCSTCSYNYAAMFFGNAAELTAAQRKTLLLTLGWAPVWAP